MITEEEIRESLRNAIFFKDLYEKHAFRYLNLKIELYRNWFTRFLMAHEGRYIGKEYVSLWEYLEYRMDQKETKLDEYDSYIKCLQYVLGIQSNPMSDYNRRKK